MSSDFWAGYISGSVGILVGNPLDLIKVRLQAGGQTGTSLPTSTTPPGFTNPFSTASSLIRGTTAPILGYGALNALLFITYNRTSVYLSSFDAASPTSSLTTTFVAGAIGGLATWVVSTPTELIKCRAQISSLPVSSFTIARDTIFREGIKGLYLGGTVTALRDSIGYGFYFWSYELSTRILARKVPQETGGTEDTARVLLCGGIAGVVTWASVFPLDVIKTRVQTQTFARYQQIVETSLGHSVPTGPSISTPLLRELPSMAPADNETICRQGGRIGAMEMAKQTYINEGMAVFFRGLGICSLRAFVVNAVQWAVYEWIMGKL